MLLDLIQLPAEGPRQHHQLAGRARHPKQTTGQSGYTKRTNFCAWTFVVPARDHHRPHQGPRHHHQLPGRAHHPRVHRSVWVYKENKFLCVVICSTCTVPPPSPPGTSTASPATRPSTPSWSTTGQSGFTQRTNFCAWTIVVPARDYRHHHHPRGPRPPS